MEKIDLNIINIIIKEMDNLSDNTKVFEYKKHIKSRKWILANIIYHYQEAANILTNYWQFQIFHDIFNRCISQEKIMDSIISKRIVEALKEEAVEEAEYVYRICLITKILENFEECVLALRRKNFFANNDCIKKELKLVDNI